VVEDFKVGLFKTLELLRDYLDQIVVGGGWVLLIYYHYLISNKRMNPVRTSEIDLMVPNRVRIAGSKTINQLLSDAGLEAKSKSIETPFTVYEGIIDGYAIEVEFLSPQRGPKEETVKRVQDDLNAQALRFISISLENNIEVEIDDYPVYPDEGILTLRIPTPGAYLFHKGLVFIRRQPEQKKAKDLYYIFDILARCPELKDQIIVDTQMLRSKGKVYQKWFKIYIRNLQEYFAHRDSEGPRLVVSQRPPDVFSDLDDEQFSLFGLEVFRVFIEDISS